MQPHTKAWIFLGFISYSLLEIHAIQNPCTPSPCGANTSCRNSGDRAVCSCLPGYYGSPLSGCIRGECEETIECAQHKACVNNKCIDVCAGTCGQGANCEAENHVPVCSCPTGFKGNPFISCRRMTSDELCNPSPCGKNTKCSVVNYVPICSCLPGFEGSALKGCTPECESDNDCRNDQYCSGYRCRSVCGNQVCGQGAICRGKDHVAVCSCPEGLIGNPQTLCRPECYENSDCGSSSLSCWNGRCMNLCENVCGIGANCKVHRNTAICSCPKGSTGNPMKICKPFAEDDLCNPNPCGSNANCQPGHDNIGNSRPVCTCHKGFIGNALISCRRGECMADEDCNSDKRCNLLTYTCEYVCKGQCGLNAECAARNHTPLCSCPSGYTGDALSRCFPASNKSRFFHY